MGFSISKPKGKDHEVLPVQSRQVDLEEAALTRIRKSLNEDLDTFLLNNILLSVQFFENFERDVKTLRKNPVSEYDVKHNVTLAEHQRHCVSPDRLYETVRRRVLFRRADEDSSQSYELLHSPRLLVVQDNVEVVEHRDDAVYSTVMETPSYRFTMETATDNHPGYMKIRAEECMLPHKRRATYETIRDEDEGVYTRMPSGSPNETDNDTNTNQEQEVDNEKNSAPPETRDVTEGRQVMTEMQNETESAGKEPPFHDVQPMVTDSAQAQRRNSIKRVFGPQHAACDPNQAAAFTPTERRLSGIMRTPKHADVHRAQLQKNLSALKAAQSLPNLAVTCSPKNSGSSGYKSEGGSPNHHNTNDAEYGYTTITELTTPRPLKERRLGQVPRNTSEIPEQCFHEIEVPAYDSDNGNFKGRKNLFETRYYLNSIAFMRSFADIFADKIGSSLGFTSGLNSATLQGTKIYCDIIKKGTDSKPIKVRNEIMPTIFSAKWPKEALKWKTRERNTIQDPRPGMQNTWPTQPMMDQVQSYGCHLLPLGYMPTRGRNDEQYLEWQLAFPEAERYLEMWLTHAQVRCLLFTLALYKTFLEPLNIQSGLLPTHIRTMLFWRCEASYAEFPDDRPGEIMCKFLDKLYDAIMHKKLPDYFIKSRNLFESTPRTHLLKVQEKLLRIRENLVMHMLSAVCNLHYVDSLSFYPVLDYKKLYDIITCDNLVPILNPLLQPKINTAMPKKKQREQQQSDEEESDEEDNNSNIDMWKPLTGQDARKKWKQDVRAQIEDERAKQRSAKVSVPRPQKPSTDFIDLKLQPKKPADKLRKMALLDFFIPHFIDIAKKSNSFRATQQARVYLQHAERLVQLLNECDDRRSKAWTYSHEIKMLREAMGPDSSYRAATTPNTYVPTQLKLPAQAGTPRKKEEHTSAHFMQPVPSQDNIFNNVNPFREKMTLPQQNIHSILKKPAILDTPLPSAENCEQSQLKTNTVTVAEVHKPSTSRKIHTHLSMPPRPDVPDAPHSPPALILTEDITDESTDT